MQRRRWCRTCDRYTLHEREDLRFHWGCLLTILTAGLFLPIWLVLFLISPFRPMRCQGCGGGRHL